MAIEDRADAGGGIAVAAAPMLACADLDVCYGDLQALWGVALAVRAGEIVALIGPNGAGKTTIMRTLAGLLFPTRGTPPEVVRNPAVLECYLGEETEV